MTNKNIKCKTCLKQGIRRVDLPKALMDRCVLYAPIFRKVGAKNNQEEIGKKYDTGKPKLAEMIQDFREPLTEVAKIWAFGAEKYDKGNWRYVSNGFDRYSNAMLRHLVAEADSITDDESELLHAGHVARNALARLHFILQEQKEVKNDRTNNN